MTRKRACARRALAALAAIAALACAPAAAWTNKPVRFIVPGPPGGTSDLVARIVGEAISARIGQPVVVENKPGAAGAIAVGTLLASPADGQTLVVGAQNLITEVPLVLKVAYDPLADLMPVAEFGRGPLVLVANAGVPARDLAEFVDYARRNRGALSYASYSAGTASHFAGLMLNRHAGLDMLHVPYKGSPPALTDLLAGQVAVMFDGLPTAMHLVRAGKLRALGVTGARRSPLLPDVPTFTELGYPQIEFVNWVGAIAPARLAPTLAARIHTVMLEALRDPNVRARLEQAGFEPSPPSTLSALHRSVRTDYARNASIVKAFGIHFE